MYKPGAAIPGPLLPILMYRMRMRLLLHCEVNGEGKAALLLCKSNKRHQHVRFNFQIRRIGKSETEVS